VTQNTLNDGNGNVLVNGIIPSGVAPNALRNLPPLLLWQYRCSSTTGIPVSGAPNEFVLWNDAPNFIGSLTVPGNIIGPNGPYQKVVFEGEIYGGGTMSFTGGQIRFYVNGGPTVGWPGNTDLTWIPVFTNAFYMTKVRWEICYNKAGVVVAESQIKNWGMFNCGFGGTWTGFPTAPPTIPGMTETDNTGLDLTVPWTISPRVRIGACTVAGNFGCRSGRLWAE